VGGSRGAELVSSTSCWSRLCLANLSSYIHVCTVHEVFSHALLSAPRKSNHSSLSHDMHMVAWTSLTVLRCVSEFLHSHLLSARSLLRHVKTSPHGYFRACGRRISRPGPLDIRAHKPLQHHDHKTQTTDTSRAQHFPYSTAQGTAFDLPPRAYHYSHARP
jgi:hypothetical protein